MSKLTYKPASQEELQQEARDWDIRVLTPRNWQSAPEAIPRAAASTTISLRIPTQMLSILKEFAQRQGVGYQVLLKRWLDDRIREEREKIAIQQVVRLRQPKMVAMAASFAPAEKQVLRASKVNQ